MNERDMVRVGKWVWAPEMLNPALVLTIYAYPIPYAVCQVGPEYPKFAWPTTNMRVCR